MYLKELIQRLKGLVDFLADRLPNRWQEQRVQYVRKSAWVPLEGSLDSPLDNRRKGLAQLRLRRMRDCAGQYIPHCGRKLFWYTQQLRNPRKLRNFSTNQQLAQRFHARIGGWNSDETGAIVRINIPSNFDQKIGQSLSINLAIVRSCSL